MMKTKLLFWLAFFSIGMQAQNIDFPDANFKALLLSSSPSNTTAKNLSGNYFAIDADGNGEISTSEALNVGELEIKSKLTTGGIEEPEFPDSQPIYNYEGINYFKNAITININRSSSPSEILDFSDLPNLQNLYTSFYSDNSRLKIINCPSLINLSYGGIRLSSLSIIGQLKKLSINDALGDQYNPAILSAIESASLLESLNLSSVGVSFIDNSEISLDLSNHQNIKSVSISSTGLHSLDLSNCSQLSSLSIGGYYSYEPKQFGSVDVSNCPLLTVLDFGPTAEYANITSLIANNCISLTAIKSSSPFMKTLEVNNCPVLASISLDANSGIQMSNVPALKEINISRFNGVSFDATPATNLEVLNLNYFNYSTSPYVNAFGSLKNLTVKNNIFLKNLSLHNQPISDLDISGMQSIEMLSATVGYRDGGDPQPNFSADFLHNLNAENCKNLQSVYVSGQMALKSGNFKECNALKQFAFEPALYAGNGIIESLNFENCTSLEKIDVNKCNLKELNIKNCTSLKELFIEKNQLEDLDLSNYSTLTNVNVSNSSQLTSLNLNNCISLEDFQAYTCPNLKYIFLKNGKNDLHLSGEDPEVIIYDFEGCNNLKYICCDKSEEDLIKKYGLIFIETPAINSYCSFTPGGNYNTISGTVKVDTNNNGCDASDNPFEFLKLKINDGTTSGETFIQQNGKYEFYTQSGNFNITALAENPALFTISPANFSTSFSDSNNNVSTQDICVTANGTQNDAEVVIAPLTGARPGFDATYKLVWRNKGNTTLSGKVVLNYDHNRMTFQSSSLPYAAISNGSIEFNYSNLKPYANEATELVFTINTPTNPTNPVNSGDVLPFNAQITPNLTDLTPEDNNFKFNQTVVNSFDPNDITCMEGEIIPTTAVGKYMHYVVNFENTGTAEAENIVVKMNIDPAEFDINTLQLQNASADVTTTVTGNEVEFKFKKIKLKAGGHGNVLLKIRSVTDLQEGDSVDNSADIYFDYNFPITTNEYVTTILDEHSLLNAKINYEAAEFNPSNYKVNFDASFSTGNIVSYAWEFPNATSVSSTSAVKPVVIYNVAGNYTAKLTISDADNNLSIKTISFKVGNTTADLSTGRDNNGNAIAIDADDDWKGYDINGTEITPKIRHTYPGWSYADIGNGNNSQWISLNNFEGYYNYKSRAFTIPNNATDAKLNLRSLSFVRNWTYLVKVEADGSETETEITKTQWQSDGFKGWLNSRSPKVDNYALSPGTYYIKVLVYSNNSTVRESLDVNAIVTSSIGLMNANKLVPSTVTLQTQDPIKQNVSIYPVPTRGELNIDSDSDVLSVEVHDMIGRILQKKYFAPSKKVQLTINTGKGIYFLKIMTKQGIVNQKIIKE